MKADYVRLLARDGILPRLTFKVAFTAEHDHERYIILLEGRLYIRSPGGAEYLVCRSCLSSFYYLELNRPREIDITFDLTPRAIEVIEELREGGDLWLRVGLYVKMMENPQELFTRKVEYIMISHREYGDLIKIAKSDWVEEYLPKLGYKRTRLIEVPLFEPVPNELSDVPKYIDEAWKHYLRGDYDDTIDNCRRAMEAIAAGVRRLNCEKSEVDEKTGKTKCVPDWKKFFGGHETLSRNFEKMFRGLWGFLQPGSHAGRTISRSEAECALITTYSLANYVIKTVLKGIKTGGK